ncbi:hypothetical protein BLNAU_17981 [Blattamonas nauphoetae]|uniref:Uncharacterized protein n=1 Tax=Blattamonas nauphoetae TaxID=2049346 RepID=A0ABQ9X646_9EUKA|nr:hypothetical protein BLNAU_17981 [Blattamonas nauphoetae]
MPVDKNSTTLQIDNAKAKHSNFLEVFLCQICGECKSLRPVMLNGLLILATDSDWALSTIHDVEYIKPFEEYCEKTRPCEVPIAFPKLLTLIAKSSEGECLRICKSSLPSFLLTWMDSISDKDMINEIGDCLSLWTSTPRSSSTFIAHHQTQFLAFIKHFESTTSSIPHVTILVHLCFSPQLEVSKMALEALSTRCKSDSKTRAFLRTLKVPSGSTDSSSELVPFAERLCSTLAEHVSEMKSLFTESSPSDGTISAHSTTLPDKSPLLSGNTVLEVLNEEFSLLGTLLSDIDDAIINILIKHDFVPLLKSTIIACLDLLDHERNELNCPPSDGINMMIEVLDWSWDCAASCLRNHPKSLHPIVESAFSDVSQLFSLLERTCHHSSPTHPSHVRMIINISAALPHLIPRMLEENLVERVIYTSKPMSIPTTYGSFHLDLIWMVLNLNRSPRDITKGQRELKRTRMLQFERVLHPAKQYLQFILPRGELIPKDDSSVKNLPTQINFLLEQTLALERELLSMNGASSFVFVSSDSSFEFVYSSAD